jgi:hypothetical protein
LRTLFCKQLVDADRKTRVYDKHVAPLVVDPYNYFILLRMAYRTRPARRMDLQLAVDGHTSAQIWGLAGAAGLMPISSRTF